MTATETVLARHNRLLRSFLPALRGAYEASHGEELDRYLGRQDLTGAVCKVTNTEPHVGPIVEAASRAIVEAVAFAYLYSDLRVEYKHPTFFGEAGFFPEMDSYRPTAYATALKEEVRRRLSDVLSPSGLVALLASVPVDALAEDVRRTVLTASDDLNGSLEREGAFTVMKAGGMSFGAEILLDLRLACDRGMETADYLIDAGDGEFLRRYWGPILDQLPASLQRVAAEAVTDGD